MGASTLPGSGDERGFFEALRKASSDWLETSRVGENGHPWGMPGRGGQQGGKQCSGKCHHMPSELLSGVQCWKEVHCQSWVLFHPAGLACRAHGFGRHVLTDDVN